MEPFKVAFSKPWNPTTEGVQVGKEHYKFSDIIEIKPFHIPKGLGTNGVFQLTVKGKSVINLTFTYGRKDEAMEALRYIDANCGDVEARKVEKEKEMEGVVYDLTGARGRSMKVYEDKCVIKVKVGIGSILTGNATDGEKTIFYVDCNGVQFKEAGFALGYIQLETASLMMNNASNNMFNENTFTFALDTVTNDGMKNVHKYIMERVTFYKKGANQAAPQIIQAAPQKSVAEELKELHELVQMGILTQEEFDQKKKEMLNL